MMTFRSLRIPQHSALNIQHSSGEAPKNTGVASCVSHVSNRYCNISISCLLCKSLQSEWSSRRNLDATHPRALHYRWLTSPVTGQNYYGGQSHRVQTSHSAESSRCRRVRRRVCLVCMVVITPRSEHLKRGLFLPVAGGVSAFFNSQIAGASGHLSQHIRNREDTIKRRISID